jgi:hypothetical protein
MPGAKIVPEVEEGTVIQWVDEHNIVVRSDDGFESDYDLGGYQIYKDGETRFHLEESEDALKLGDRVRVTTVRHVEVLRGKVKKEVKS